MKSKTLYLSEEVIGELERVKKEKGLKSANDVFEYFLNIERILNRKKETPLERRLRFLEQRIEILTLLVADQSDHCNLVPEKHFDKGESKSYKAAKKIVSERVKRLSSGSQITY